MISPSRVSTFAELNEEKEKSTNFQRKVRCKVGNPEPQTKSRGLKINCDQILTVKTMEEAINNE